MKRLLHLLLTFSLVFNIGIVLVNTIPVYASTETLTVSGEGTYSEGTYVGGSTNATNLTSDDGDTSYIKTDYVSSPGETHTWNYSNITASASTINSVTVYFKVKAVTTSHTYYFIARVGGSNYSYGSYTADLTGSYALISYTWDTNPNTGSKWTVDEVNSSEFGYQSKGLNELYDTYSYVVVDYTAQTVPTVTTQAVSDIIYNAAHYALLNGNITSDGGNTTDVRGFVYDTATHALPGNVAPAASGYSTNSSAYSSAIGAYTSNITGMAANTRYYVRAFAHNGIGYAYGDEVNFITIGSPTVSTMSATLVGDTTAQLNGQVTFDGNTSCNISFGYGLTTQPADWSLYTVHTNVAGTYTTGQFPSLSLSSLNTSSTYYYNIRIQNAYSTAYGIEGSFTTESGVYEPSSSSITAIPSSGTISLLWTKGSGAVSTLCRYQTGTYPTNTSEGTNAYFGTGNSVLVTGLSPGVTYKFSFWGYTGGVYSTNYTTCMATTTAFGTTTTPVAVTPPADSRWNQTPDSTLLENIPWISTLLADAANSYNMPVVTVWYFVWIVFAAGIGFWMYNKRRNVVGSFMAECAWMGLGAFLGLTMLWIVAILLIVAIGFTIYGDRR